MELMASSGAEHPDADRAAGPCIVPKSPLPHSSGRGEVSASAAHAGVTGCQVGL